MPGPIDIDMDEIEAEDSWKKKEEEKRKRIDKLKKKLPNNKVVQEMNGSEQKKKQMSGEWELIDSVTWAARDAYFEEGLTLKEAVSQLKEALDQCVVMCNDD